MAKESKNWPKISNFTILATTLIETPRRSIRGFWGANLSCCLRGNVVWNFYPICMMLTKTTTTTTTTTTTIIMTKIQNFTILWTPLVETLPRSLHNFLGVKLVCTFRGDVVWNLFYHMVPYYRKRKKIVKNKKLQFCKKQTNKQNKTKEKWSGDMVDRYLAAKFGVNPLDGFRENTVCRQRTLTPW